MNKNINYFLSCTFILCSLLCFAQQNKIDSLRALLKTLNRTPSQDLMPTVRGTSANIGIDTTKINILNSLARELMYNNPDTSIILGTQALNLALALQPNSEMNPSSEKIYKVYSAKSYLNLGIYNWLKDNYTTSLDNYFKALKIKESLKDKKGISAIIGGIGLVYYSEGSYPKALNYYFKALAMTEELGDKRGMAIQLSNIGIVYSLQKDYLKALDNFSKALKIATESGDKNGIASHLINIGDVYESQGENIQALEYYYKALKILEEIGNKTSTATVLGNIGLIYHNQRDYSKALDYYFRAMKIDELLGNKNGITRHMNNIGSLYTDTKKYPEAEKYLQKALALSTSINALGSVKNDVERLSELYEKMNQTAKALEYYKKYKAANDSLFNEANTKKTVRSEMNFEFEKKQAIEKTEQEKRDVMAQEEKQKQKTILILVFCFLLFVIVFASFLFNRWRITQKQKLIIEKQKEKIVDSITYAQLIQQSILMDEREIKKQLPDSFIYNQPKDIVSGDFYWCSRVNNKIILAAIDCTGHGVPGAFMSMIGNMLLNQIVNEKQILIPTEILQLLSIGIIESLNQKKEGALSRDGMDISLCCIDYENNQIQYAGAQNPLYIITNNELTVINADKHSIGGGGLIVKERDPSTITFTNHVVPIKENMSIYMFSDGYMDQFGGNKREKFGRQRFKELLLNNQQLNMQQQKEILIKAHLDWKGNTAQIDDILVIGLKL